MVHRIAGLAALIAASTAMAQVEATDIAGKRVQLFGAGNSKSTVLIFVRTDCPIANRYAPEIQRLHRAYESKVDFYLVYADAGESAEIIRKHMGEYRYSLAALRDPEHALIRLGKAKVTPEAALFSAWGELLYHGRIDNRYVSFGKSMSRPTRKDLELAIEAILAGKAVQEQTAAAIGCSLADSK
jgi:hypothetical protein